MTWAEFLPLLFLAVMGLALLAYVVLDGYDLGVGMLLPLGTDAQKDTMISSIGPFWDANETWLVLGVGVLLVAFPKAHGMVLQALYQGIGPTIVAMILFLKAVSILGAERMGALVALVPVLAGLGAVPLLDEPLTPWLVAGLALVSGGAWLASRPIRH